MRAAVDGRLHAARRRRARGLLSSMEPPRTVLFVCLGNVCRSPYAEARFRQRALERDLSIDARSAGLIGPGRPPPKPAILEAGARGLDTGGHRSRVATREAVAAADLVVVMETGQARRVRRGREGPPCIVLGDLDPEPVRRRTIRDPWGADEDVFATVFERIDRCVEVLVAVLEDRRDPASDTRAFVRADRIAAEDSSVPIHHLTIDVEEVFHSTLLAERVPQHQWDTLPRRSPEVVRWLLDEMAARDASGTFFVLGWLAEREPDLVRAISEAGHEIAAHSWAHRPVPSLGPDGFRASLRRTKDVLEQIVGRPVVGFRAPSFSIVPGCEWAFDVLLDEGYRYDSSLFPISMHPQYGYPDADPDPHWVCRGASRLAEIPPLTVGVLGRRLPAGGGAYLRFFPLRLFRAALRQAEARGAPGTLYVHPWDLDPDLPRMRLGARDTLRLYSGARRARRRLVRLLAEVRSVPIARTVDGMSREPTP